MTLLEIKLDPPKREVNCHQCRKILPANSKSFVFRLVHKGFRIKVRTCRVCGINYLGEVRNLINQVLAEAKTDAS